MSAQVFDVQQAGIYIGSMIALLLLVKQDPIRLPAALPCKRSGLEPAVNNIRMFTEFAQRRVEMRFITRKFFCAAVLAVTAATVAAAQSPSDVLSEINGEKITRAELEEKRGKALHQPRYQLFTAEQKALDEIIADRLLEKEAQRQKLTVQQLIERNVKQAVKEPTEDQLQLYYELSKSKEPYEAVRGKILDIIRQNRESKALTAYIEKLRAAANVVVTLAPPKAEFDVSKSPRFGSSTAPVQLVEFADYECPYCQKVHPYIKKLREEFAGKVSVVFKDLPLPNHPKAQKAAEASRCAGAAGKYWEYHDLLFSGGGLDVKQLKQYARELGLDGARFDQCLDKGEYTAAVQSDLTEAQELGLNGTPSFFLNDQFFSGAVDYESLRDMVNKELARKQSRGSEISQKR